MYDKEKVIKDKKLPYAYNICLYILKELGDKRAINVLSKYKCYLFSFN